MGDVPSNSMLKHLKEECSNISEELPELSEYDNDENATHHNMQKTMDKSIPSNEMAAIHQQILRALLSEMFLFQNGSAVSTEILDQVHKEVDREIQTFAKADFIRYRDMAKAQCLMREDLEIESEQATLGQVAASWVWLRGIIEKLPSSESGFKTLMANKIDNR
ncbi:hypothetical protein RhiirA1_461946 [Rhizophagus irregularis]|uniref:Uncharacterized protein n=1 Tax=Rhizophagus irregularis TaxID=588596 RepID=A0A2N0RNB0_9GLOM|nr:hypothetical protein RhiirA1_461946 [Rhizophagus irregularis]